MSAISDGYFSCYFPSPNLVSLNVRSLSIRGGNNKEINLRRDDVRESIRAMTRHADVILLQEARYDMNFCKNVEGYLPGYAFYHNPLTTASAGTFMAVKSGILRDFDLEHVIIVKGYIHRLNFKPKDPSSSLPFSITNVYLYTGSVERYQTVKKQMEAITELGKPDGPNFMMGDFNLVFDSAETTGSTHRSLPGYIRDLWDELCAILEVTELDQPLHTWFALRDGNLCSSKLDRVCVPEDEKYWSVKVPSARLHPPR